MTFTSTPKSAKSTECGYGKKSGEPQCNKNRLDSSSYCKDHQRLDNSKKYEKKKVPNWINGPDAKTKVKDLINDKYRAISRLAVEKDILLSQVKKLKKKNHDLEAHLEKCNEQVKPVEKAILNILKTLVDLKLVDKESESESESESDREREREREGESESESESENENEIENESESEE
ncbi:hypothetical protein BGZ67_004075 [Mortierella alpina]|nr:hypothetical protein BGZ67_004075 [Mortierella alpina]